MLFGLAKKIKICIVLPWLQCFPTVQQLHIVKSSNKQRAAIRVIQYFCFCLTQSRSAAACMHQTTGLPALAGRQRGQGAGVRVLGSPMVTNIGHWSQQQSLSIGGFREILLGPCSQYTVLCWQLATSLYVAEVHDLFSDRAVMAWRGLLAESRSHMLFLHVGGGGAGAGCGWPGGSTLKCI